MRFLYVIFSYLLFGLLFPALSLHRKTRHGLRQRLGFYRPKDLPLTGHPRIWLHGSSAGDLLALAPMVGLLKEKFPQCCIILSTTTNTGHLMATQRLRSQIDAAIYWPYDIMGATRRAVKAVKPDLLVLEYTEIWPNLIRATKKSGAKVALTNGRFSQTHLSRYRAFFSLIGNPLKDIDLFLMREADEAERALALGAPPNRVQVTGNTKFDALANAHTETSVSEADLELRRALGIPEGALVWIAGSTHEGEEGLLVSVFRGLLKDFPNLYLVIAPRYIDRAAKVAALVEQAGFSVVRRSQKKPPGKGVRVAVLDTIGELPRVYRLGTLVFVGGSFIRRGGQNILEPAAHGKPVLFGPHMQNFHDSVQVLVGRGGIQVNDAEHLQRVVAELLARPENLQQLGELAQAAVRQVSGAGQRNVDALAKLISSGEWPLFSR